jgi:(2Fe-2S) ferredoxin
MNQHPASRDLGVILVGRGSLYSGQPGEELAALATDLRSARLDALVVEALLEQGENSLTSALDNCARAGVLSVAVVPVFIPVEAATRNWLQFVARRWLRKCGSPIRITIAEDLTWHPATAEVVNDLAQRALDSGKPLAAHGPAVQHADPDWSVIPTHSYHVLFCQGPRCTAAGAGELGAYLRKRLKEKGLEEGPDHVLAARASCLYPCNLGPVMVVYPEGTWYCGLDEEAVDRIIQEHFIGGETVEGYAYKPAPERQTLSGANHPNS